MADARVQAYHAFSMIVVADVFVYVTITSRDVLAHTFVGGTTRVIFAQSNGFATTPSLSWYVEP